MGNYKEVRFEQTSTHLNKLKSTARHKTGTTLK